MARKTTLNTWLQALFSFGLSVKSWLVPSLATVLVLFSTQTIQAQSISIVPSIAGALHAGDVITYTVTVTNNTSTTISGASVSDPIPGAPFLYVPNSLTVSGTSLTCTVPTTITPAISISGFDLLPNESLVYRFQMKVPDTYSGSSSISHTATSGAASATQTNTVSAIPNVVLTKVGTTEVTPGSVNKVGLIYYTITVTNTGTATANGVTVSDILDTKVRIAAANLVTVSQNYIGTYSVTSGNAIANTSIGVTLGNIPQGGSATITFRVRLLATATSGTVINTATATGTNTNASGTGSGTATSNTTSHVINTSKSCANRDVYYLSANGNNATAEINNPDKPWQSFKTIIDLINASGGYSVLRFLDAYYPTSVSGSVNPVLTTPCVTIDGNFCIFDRNSGASVGFLEVNNGANGDTIRNLRLTNFNKSPNCSFDIIGTSTAAPISNLVVEDVDVYATQSVKATNFVNVLNAKFVDCDWYNNPFGAIDIVDAKITFTNCTFSCNTRGGQGGAINARIKSGGGSSDAHFTDLTFIGGKFSGNSGTGGGADGGAIYMGCGTLTIKGTEFDCNSSDASTGLAGGGAIRLASESGASLKPIANIKNAVFYNNTCSTSTDGGAILSTTTGSLTLDKCIFKSNVSGNGSAINVNANCTLNNCLFDGNTTGAAIVGSPSAADSITVKNNSSGVSGTIGNLSNSLICGNTGTNMSAHPTTVSNSLYGTSAEAVNNATITLLNEGAAAATAGWTFTNPTTALALNDATSQGAFTFTNATATNAIQQTANGAGGAADGFWLLEDADIVETPALNLLNYPGNIVVTYKSKRVQSNVGQSSTAQTTTLQYSLDGGATWLAASVSAALGTTWVSNNFTVPFATTTANMKFRWFKTTTGATRQDSGIDDIQITYNTSAIQSAGFWSIETTDLITSPDFDLTNKSNVIVQFQVATFAGATAGTVNTPCTFEYSTNGGASWTSTTTNTPTSTTMINAFAGSGLVIGAPNVANFRMRFSKAAGTNFKSISIDNITIIYDQPITCSSTSVGSNLTMGTYACLGACPTNPTGTTNCVSFDDLGNISLGSGCRFINTYTGDFATATPVQLQPAQSVVANVSNFFFVNSPANTYEWRWLVVNASGNIVQVVTPANHTTGVTNTTITPSFSPVVPGTYSVYGYYFNKNSTSAPTVGTALSTLSTNICGSLSKTFANFEILAPVVVSVSNACVNNGVNACDGRYFNNVTIVGGYPQYASTHGMVVPQYVIGADLTYTPTAYTNEMTAWVSYNTPTDFATNYVAGNNFGVKVEDDKNCTTYPFALDVAAYTGATDCGLTISGTVLQDPDGVTDGLIDGTGLGNPSTTTLYAYLYYVSGASNIVLAQTTVNPDGTYNFGSGFSPNQNYQVAISATNLSGTVVGTNLPSLTLPSNWVNTGEGLSTTPDGTINALTNVSVATSDVLLINFGIERLPVVTNSAALAQGNPGGTTTVPVNSSLFTNSDPDGTIDHIHINSFPTNTTSFSVGTTTYYSSVDSIPGTCPTATCMVFPIGGLDVATASNGQPTPAITVDPQNGSINVVFDYTAIDNAGYPSASSGTLTMPFGSSLPIQLLYFNAQGLNINTNQLNWATAMELDNAYFILEHSRDAVNFEEIGRTIGAGNSNSTLTYHYNHNQPASGLNYYRLTQVDYDGTSTKSNIAVVDNRREATNIQVFPNPTDNLVNFTSDTPIRQVSIHNTLGELVKQVTVLDNGISLQELPSGVYYLTFKTDFDIQTQKVIKK